MAVRAAHGNDRRSAHARLPVTGLPVTGLLAAALLAATLSACISPVSDRLYEPQPIAARPPVWQGPAPIRVTAVAQDGTRLGGWYWAPATANGDVLIYLPGRAGNRDVAAQRAQAFADGGHGVLVASYRGYGDNPGTPSEAGLYEDGHAFIRLARRLAPHARLFLFGDTLGGAVALHVAADEPVAAVATLGTFDRYASFAPALSRPFYADSYDNLAAIRRLRVPILLMHGKKDEVVPFAAAERLRAAAGDRATVVPIAGEAYHAFDLRHIAPVVWQALAEVTRNTPAP